jgi:hypothetical protein
MTQHQPWLPLREQLVQQNTEHYVIFTPAGQVVDKAGDFNSSAEKCETAYSIVQQCGALLKPQEKLKKVTMCFDDAMYVATVTLINSKPFGVVVKRPPQAL